MVYEQKSSLDRLVELSNEKLSLDIVILGSKNFRLETNKFSKPHNPSSIIVFPDGVEIRHASEQSGNYGQLYVQPLGLIVTYHISSNK